MAIEVRLASEHDADGIAAAHTAAWQVGYRGLMPADYLESLDVVERAAGWRRSLSRPHDEDPVIVATMAGKVAGFAAFGPAHADEPTDVDSGTSSDGDSGRASNRDSVDSAADSAAATDAVPARTDGELYALNVHPDHWRGGIGTALLQYVHAGLEDLGFRNAILWMHPGNERARRFYEARGWRDDGAERDIEIFGITVPITRYRCSW
jgi:GNAT superfamily N-acetyltransferase